MEGSAKIRSMCLEHGCMDENFKNIEKLLHKFEKEDIMYL